MKRIILAAAALLVLAGTARSTTLIDRIVAIVGSDVITQSELDQDMAPKLADLQKTMRGDELAQATTNLRNGDLNELIDKKLQLQEAKFQGITVEDADLDAAIKDIKERNKMDDAQFEQALQGEGYTLADYRESLREQLTLIRLVNVAVKSRVMVEDSEITAYYNEHKDEFTDHASVRVANIFFPAKSGDMDAALADAKAAKAKIDGGESFEEMAVKCTGDPKAGESCVLGTFGRGQLSKEVEKAAFGMKAGEVSDPIKADNGYQLIKVMAATEEKVKPLEDVRSSIVEELNVKKGEELYAKWIKELRDRTYVEIRN